MTSQYGHLFIAHQSLTGIAVQRLQRFDDVPKLLAIACLPLFE
ncbi:hypothetical protein [Stenomitos frigidus]|nr:hypothetical protein [Stenomitos frigidus]